MTNKTSRVSLKRLLKENKNLILFISLMCVFRSAVADWYTVPTGSMLPTIQLGDRITVNKMAYDLRVPFSSISVYEIAEPERGDIVVFESKAANERLIKRIIGLPGDRIAMLDDVVFLNGKALPYKVTRQSDGKVITEEKIDEISHIVNIDKNAPEFLSSFSEVEVPKESYLVLGDNRRNSSDSRVYGFVPRSELRGKAYHVVFSSDYDNYYIPRSERVLQSLY
ncbi:signal peptidase I [Pseudoalteromonas spongiae]|uniref:signal peptidase I n=1 Tax=Pseudoalteromonas spongiae TaxID=298657 RepID=UPI00110AED58|nr:signal peptidase I [Pseudoalteromonas spongiae]TMO82795.1 signal peptidase I [Pseudoalteromonas spongiae]